MAKSNLTFSYIVLVIIGICCFVSYIFVSDGIWQNLSLNIGTEVVGIVLVLVLIDRIVKKHHDEERERVRRLALQRLLAPIYRHFEMLIYLQVASVMTRPAKTCRCVSDVFDDDYVQAIQWLDFSGKAPVAPNAEWFKYLSEECRAFKGCVESMLDKYVMHLSSPEVELLESLLRSNFLGMMISMPHLATIQQVGNKGPYNLLAGDGADQAVKKYLGSFVKLVNLCGELVSSDTINRIMDSAWSGKSGPRIGSSRVAGQQLPIPKFQMYQV